MNGVTRSQRDAVRAKAEALLGEPLGSAGDLLAEIACERAMAHCSRADIPKEMEQAVAGLLVGLVSREAGVKSVTRGDTSVSYADTGGADYAPLAPWRRLGTLKEG